MRHAGTVFEAILRGQETAKRATANVAEGQEGTDGGKLLDENVALAEVEIGLTDTDAASQDAQAASSEKAEFDSAAIETDQDFAAGQNDIVILRQAARPSTDPGFSAPHFSDGATLSPSASIASEHPPEAVFPQSMQQDSGKTMADATPDGGPEPAAAPGTVVMHGHAFTIAPRPPTTALDDGTLVAGPMPSRTVSQIRLAGISANPHEARNPAPSAETAACNTGKLPGAATDRPQPMPDMARPFVSNSSDGQAPAKLVSTSDSGPSTAKAVTHSDPHFGQPSPRTADNGNSDRTSIEIGAGEEVTAHSPTRQSAAPAPAAAAGKELNTASVHQTGPEPDGIPAEGLSLRSAPADTSEFSTAHQTERHSRNDLPSRRTVSAAPTDFGHWAAQTTQPPDVAAPRADSEIGNLAPLPTQHASLNVEAPLPNNVGHPPPSPGAPPTRQVAEAIIRSGVESGQTELVLSPEELGKVQFSIRNVDGQLSVVISAERPETLSLLRRNADLLATELAQSGMGNAALDFGGGGQTRDHGANKPRDDVPSRRRVQDILPAPPNLERDADAIRNAIAGGRINIRL